MRTVKIAAAIIACAIQAYGAATVTASREYVDRKTTLHPSSNGVEQVGYFLGTQTNKVLASKEYVDNSISASSPGDYLNVSNNAYMASSDTLKRLFSVAAYPAWEKSRQSSGNYTAGDIVSYSGMVYRCISTPSGTEAPDEYSSKWEVKTIGDLIAENTPGDYSNVSNNAYGALQKVDTTNTVNSIITNSSSGVLSMAFAYPLARFDYFNLQYPPNGSIVEKDGRLYRAKNDGYGDGSPWFPVDDTYYFEDVTEEMGTNALVRLSTLNMKKNDRITDEVNTIFANRKVYFQPMATNYYNRLTGPLSLTTINETNGVVTAADWGDGVQDGIGIFWMGGTWFLRQGSNTTSMTNGTPNDETVELGNYMFVRQIVPNGPPVYVGNLALTNDIDYTSSNTQLVATIEATAPAPGNYPAVSNAAMNARGIMDFNVRGAPEPGNGFFIVDGDNVLTWIDTDDPQEVGWYGSIHVTTNSSGYEVVGGPSFSLDSDFTSSFEYNGEEHVIVGYTDEIAFKRAIRVSKISDGTNTICASRHVFGDTNWVVNPSFYIGDSPWYYGETITIVETGVEGEWWRPVCVGDFIGTGKGSKDSTVLTWSPDEAYIGITARRGSATPYVGMLALTNDIPISKVGDNSYEIYGSIAQGTNVTASGLFSHAEGDRTLASGKASHAEGVATRATGEASHASGVNVYATQRATFGAGVSVTGTNSASFIWSGSETSPWYGTHGKGTFNVNPIGGASGFFIGNENLIQVINASLMSDEPHAVTIEYDEGQPVTTNYPALRAAVEQIVLDTIRENSLSGIYDPQLQTWWTPAIINGSYKFMATTNVDMNAESEN